MNSFAGQFFIDAYLIAHLPAIIMLIVGLTRIRSRPESAKKLFTIAGIYFLIGGGICGLMYV